MLWCGCLSTDTPKTVECGSRILPLRTPELLREHSVGNPIGGELMKKLLLIALLAAFASVSYMPILGTVIGPTTAYAQDDDSGNNLQSDDDPGENTQ